MTSTSDTVTSTSESNKFIDLSSIDAGDELNKDEQLKQAVFDMLCSGWSAAAISRHLLRTRGIQIRPYTIKQFFDNIPASLILPPSFIKKKLLELDIQVDALGEMQRLLAITEERLSVALLVEDVAPSEDAGSGSKRGITVEGTRMTQVYWGMLAEFIKLQQSLGDIPKVASELHLSSGEAANGSGGQGPKTLRELLEETKAATDAHVVSDASDDDAVPTFAETTEPEPEPEPEPDNGELRSARDS